MSVGIAGLDHDHERIIAALNDVVAAHDRHVDRSEIDALFTDLMAVVEGHFVREERAMSECNYDGLSYHVGEHRRIRERLLSIQEHELHEADEALRAEVREFLTNWLYGHVLVDDFAYRACFGARREAIEALLGKGA